MYDNITLTSKEWIAMASAIHSYLEGVKAVGFDSSDEEAKDRIQDLKVIYRQASTMKVHNFIWSYKHRAHILYAMIMIRPSLVQNRLSKSMQDFDMAEAKIADSCLQGASKEQRIKILLMMLAS